MIILERDGLKMEVCTELQASAFEKNGYVRVQGKAGKAEEPKQAEAVAETPKKRGRKAAAKS